MLHITEIAVAATATAKMSAEHGADTRAVAVQPRLCALPVNLRAPGPQPSLQPAELGHDLAIRLPAVKRCAGCGQSNGLLRCQACMGVLGCAATCQRADRATHAQARVHAVRPARVRAAAAGRRGHPSAAVAAGRLPRQVRQGA